MESRLDTRDNYVGHALDLFARYGPREAMVAGSRRLTYDDLRTGILQLASALRRHGVRPGTTVAVLTGNPPEAPLLQCALHLLGCRTVWIALGEPRWQLDEFLRRAAVEVLVYDARDQARLGRELAANLPGVAVLCLGPDGTGPDLLADPADRTDPGPVANEPESVFMTSGTTGEPKLVHHRHSFYRQALRLADAWADAGLPPQRHLALTAFWRVSGQLVGLVTLFGGGLLVLDDRWDPARFLATLERERISSTFVSPPMLYELLDHPALPDTDTSGLFMLNVGGAPATPDRLRQAAESFGPVLRIVYGLSESALITAYPRLTYDPDHPERLSSCGTAYGDVRIEIRDEHNRALTVGEVGEVWVASTLNFAGYLGQPELTAQTLSGGWMRTRDIGYLDGDGYLYLVDRVQDMIITGARAQKVLSRPVEDALCRHPHVREAAVVGVPDPAAGEAVHAYVVADPDAAVTPEELRALVRDQLTELWAPRSVEFVDRLPLTALGKVDKKALRARHAAGPGSVQIGTSV